MKVMLMKYNLLFLGALLLAFIGMLMTDIVATEWFLYVGLILGVLLGFLNVTRKESLGFMIAYLVLATVSGVFAVVPMLGEYVTNFFTVLLSVFGPAAFIVAVKKIWKTAGSA